jgi:hypothetical protein
MMILRQKNIKYCVFSYTTQNTLTELAIKKIIFSHSTSNYVEAYEEGNKAIKITVSWNVKKLSSSIPLGRRQ